MNLPETHQKMPLATPGPFPALQAQLLLLAPLHCARLGELGPATGAAASVGMFFGYVFWTALDWIYFAMVFIGF